LRICSRIIQAQAGTSAQMMINFVRGAYWKILIQPVDPELLRLYLEDLAGEVPTVARCSGAIF
jgi:hypothetical protein